MDSQGVKEVSVRFVTKEEKKVPETPFTVPITLARYGLSEIVNHLLHQEGSDIVAYEFLIDGQFLRTTLEDYLQKAQVGKEENVIVIEYTQAAPQPESVGQTPHPDWISSINIFSLSRHYYPPSLQQKQNGKIPKIKNKFDRWAITGCYDGQIRLWNLAANNTITPLGSGRGHTSAVKAVHFLDAQRVVSASKDCSLRFWKFSSPFSFSTSTNDTKQEELMIKNYAIGYGHDDAVECLSVCPPVDPDLPIDLDDVNNKIKIASGGWDGKIFVWSVSMESEDIKIDKEQSEDKENKMVIEEDSTKKRKRHEAKENKHATEEDKKEVRWQRKQGGKLLQLSPLLSLGEDRKQCVSALSWASHSSSSLYSGGWDYNITLWDTVQAKPITTWNGRAVVSGLDFNIMGNLLASSHHDQMIRIWDPRQKELQVLKFSLRSHKGWCSSVSWNESNPRVLASTSYDSTIKLWDIRSNTPIHTIPSHTDKVLTIKHVNRDTWVSGGADRQLRIHST